MFECRTVACVLSVLAESSVGGGDRAPSCSLTCCRPGMQHIRVATLISELKKKKSNQSNKTVNHRKTLPSLSPTRLKIAVRGTHRHGHRAAARSRARGAVPSRPLAELQDEWALTCERKQHFESKMEQLPALHSRLLKLPSEA